MIEHRPYSSLGSADHGWLQATHHFSFANYHNPQRMHWGALRVWNDDIIAAGAGFPPHPHSDMEIITYVKEGAITHQDSLGNKGRTEAGDVQVMSAGTGIVHSEYNLEDTETRLFQIWIYPDQKANPPCWGTKPFPKNDRSTTFTVLASGFAEDTNALPIRSQARVLGLSLQTGKKAEYVFEHSNRYGYMVVAKGACDVNGLEIHTGDGVAIHQESQLQITALTDCELVLVDSGA